MINNKRLICSILCITLIFGITGCKSNNTLSESSYSTEVSTITEVYDQTQSNNSSNTNTSSNDNSSDDNNSDNSSDDDTSGYNPNNLPTHDFKELTSVNVMCVKDIPYADAVYEVTSILNDDDFNVGYASEIVCDKSEIKIDDKLITVPYSYKQKHNSVTLTARHIDTGLSIDFKITFNKWNLAFEDNFEGNQLDTTKWSYCPHHCRNKGYANHWSDDMTFVKDGYLVSRALNTGEKHEHKDDGPLYKSGAVWSKDLFESAYGYYEASVKPHLSTGMWGAFWLVTGDMDTQNPADDSSGVNGAEIDIFESLKNLGISHAVHWDGWTGYTKSMPHKGYQTSINVFDGKFHTFALRWTPDEYVFLIDGNVTLRTAAGGICKEKGYLNITTECGTWGGNMLLKEGEYSDMLVDYVRVYTTNKND